MLQKESWLAVRTWKNTPTRTAKEYFYYYQWFCIICDKSLLSELKRKSVEKESITTAKQTKQNHQESMSLSVFKMLPTSGWSSVILIKDFEDSHYNDKSMIFSQQMEIQHLEFLNSEEGGSGSKCRVGPGTLDLRPLPWSREHNILFTFVTSYNLHFFKTLLVCSFSCYCLFTQRNKCCLSQGPTPFVHVSITSIFAPTLAHTKFSINTDGADQRGTDEMSTQSF